MKFIKHTKFFLFLFLWTTLEAKAYVTAHLNGQLGNQMHQVAAAVSLALDYDTEALFPEFKIRTDEGIPVNCEKIFTRLNMDDLSSPLQAVWQEPKHTFVPIKYTPNMELRGHYQSYKYFDKHRDVIVNLFSPNDNLLKNLKNRFSQIIDHPQTVAIHIRTYHQEDPKNSNFAKCGPRYVKEAIKHFPKNSQFVVFSDDIPWCRKKLSRLAKNMIFMEGNSHIEDFYLISLCKHQIISNSTFSWWAAYLNENPNKKVVAPKRWFVPRREYDNHDIVPDDWEVVDNIKG